MMLWLAFWCQSREHFACSCSSSTCVMSCTAPEPFAVHNLGYEVRGQADAEKSAAILDHVRGARQNLYCQVRFPCCALEACCAWCAGPGLP